MAVRCLVASLVLTCALVAPAAASGRNPVLLGVYPSGPDLASHLESLADIDAWIAPTGRRIALAGDFLDIEYTPAVAVNLSATWDSGRIPFVKLLTVRTAADIANGLVDPAISAWGRAFARWSAGGQRRAFVAPLAEMNGNWIPYYSDAATSVRAYRRIRTLVNAELQAARVPPNAIGWVFAPNGWSQPGDEFERFYPGHDEADAVGFSAYNWGRCPPWHKWDTFETGFLPYLVRIRAMAPGKPIFIAETAVIDRLSRPIG